MTVVVSGTGADPSAAPLSSRSTSRSKASGMRFNSSNKVRHGGGGSSHGGAGSSTLGGHPMTGADPSSSKMDIKHRFEITAKLGSGTYGKVSLAYDHKMEREVAVKLIKKSAIENKQDLVRIRREIRIMSMLKHPNIIQIYEVFENKDKIILVMEYANGGELYDYVSKFGSLPESEARRIFRQITSAVLYCHKHKVAHRDLKLENILLDSTNNAKIADFGLSNYFNEKTLLTTFCGSPLYASPEIINGTPYKGPEVDCWSLGILLYTLVYGSMPFDGRDFNRMVRQIKRGAYYEPDTPSTASMLVRNMLRVNPARRADIDDIASHWWLNLEENMPVIQELPENQIIDHTPLTERAEIMVVQDLADETDVFMEFGHLSHSTRQKIEEFRRRRKEAEEYNENSPIKPPKTRRTSNANESVPELTSKEKSLRHQEEPMVAATSIIPSDKGLGLPVRKDSMKKDAFQDPLERLRQLENRLSGKQQIAAPSPVEAATPEMEQPPGTTSSRRGSSIKQLEKKSSQNVKEVVAEVIGSGKLSLSKKSSVKEEKEKSKSKPDSALSSPTKKVAPLSFPSTEQPQEDQPSTSSSSDRRPAFISPTETTSAESAEKSGPLAAVAAAVVTSRRSSNPQQYWRLETDSLNVLMNQVLEQMEKGQVSMNLVGRIKAHPFYDQRPMVKELLESIISAQPASVQEEASKLIQQQQSQDLVRRQATNPSLGQKKNTASKSKASGLPDLVPESPKTKVTSGVAKNLNGATKAAAVASYKYKVAELPSDIEGKKALLRKTILDERPWHSVEVGFSTDDDSSSNNTDAGEGSQSKVAAATVASAPKFIGTRTTRSEPLEGEDDYDDEEEDEFYDAEEDEEEEYESDIDELAQVVENVTKNSRRNPAAPIIVENLAESAPHTPKQPLEISSNHLSTLERGLAKRQSKGKYQVEMYGRGVSTEAESPPPTKRRIGGPQPKPEQSPILFDKAKNYLMNYPDKLNDSDNEEALKLKDKKKLKAIMPKDDPTKWLRTQDPDVQNGNDKSSTVTPTPTSVPPRTPPAIKSDEEENGTEEYEDEEEEEEEEESEDEGAQPFRPRPSTIIGFRTIQPIGSDGIRKEAPIVQVKPQAPITPTTPSSSSISKKLTTNKSTENKGQTTSKSTVAKAGSTDTKAEKPTKKQVAQQPPITPTSPSAKSTAASSSKNYSKEAATVFSTSLDEAAQDEIVVDSKGMQKYETAAAYIRRKNRERRARNMTIAVTDDVHEAWTRLAENRREDVSPPAQSPTKPSPIESAILRRKSSLSGIAGTKGSVVANSETKTVSNEASNVSPVTSYHRPSYLDERKLQQQYEPNYSRQTYVDRRKSFHEMTPNRDTNDDRCLSPFSSGAYDRYGIGNFGLAGDVVGAFGGPPLPTSNVSRYEDEVYNAFYPASSMNTQAWNSEPNRFEVYRTRAERAAEYNASNYGYRSSGAGSHYYGDHRPTSAYVPGSYGLPSSTYKSRYEVDSGPAVGNYSSHRRSFYNDERATTPSGDQYALGNVGNAVYTTSAAAPIPPDSPNGSANEGGFLSRFRPVTRRLGSALRDVDGRRARARSQSNDHMYSTREEIDFNGPLSARLMTPDMGVPGFDRPMMPMEYGYINFHDSGRNTTSQPRGNEPDVSMTPARSILKNKQAYEVEPRANVPKETANPGILGRLRRHLSTEKSISPTTGAYATPASARFGFASNRYESLGSFGGNGAMSGGATSALTSPLYVNHNEGTIERTVAESGGLKNKRSFLNLARRRTAEVRMLPDGKITSTTNSYLDDDYKRPRLLHYRKRFRSPIDRIKSLFRGKNNSVKDSGPAGSVIGTTSSVIGGAGGAYSNYGISSSTSNYTPSSTRFSSALSSMAPSAENKSLYSSSGYQTSSNQSPNTQFKRYTGAATSMNRYSGARGSPRNNWYEDPHLF